MKRTRRPGLPGRLRIIAGTWRGRRLPVPDVPGLRPTPDRIRETLFNWLQPVMAGARCLDLFAGSGALGLEAASRGAAEVIMVERDPKALAALHQNIEALKAAQVRVHPGDALAFLSAGPRPFDVVFLDPPFRRDLLETCVAQLDSRGWLAQGAHIYLEAEAELGTPPLPEGWGLLRTIRAGEVCASLAVRNGS